MGVGVITKWAHKLVRSHALGVSWKTPAINVALWSPAYLSSVPDVTFIELPDLPQSAVSCSWSGPRRSLRDEQNSPRQRRLHAARSKREVMLAMASRFIEEHRWPVSFPANPAVYRGNEQFKFCRRHQSSVWTRERLCKQI